jgi:asparagine synthase (glutamine-hydrolysing)
LLEWLGTLPSSHKLQGGQGKHLFKKALEPHLPSDLLYRQKQGFSVPLARWFRGPLRQRVRDTLLGRPLAASGLFEPQALRDIVDQNESGQRDHSVVIWSFLMFDAFLRNAHGAVPVRCAALAA